MYVSEQRLDAAITRSTQSVGERKRRTSGDDNQAHPMYQQTIHGKGTLDEDIVTIQEAKFL